MKASRIIPALGLMLTTLISLSSCQNGAAYYQFTEEELDINNSDVVRTGSGYGNYCPSTATNGENPKILVVPVKFTDSYEISSLGDKTLEDARQDIYNVNFGESSDTGWESLKSYYYKSSYGKLNFEGVVAPWVDAYYAWERQTPTDATSFAKNTTAAAFGQNIMSDFKRSRWKELVDEDGNQLYQSSEEFLADFDSDGDGSIDYLEMVYLCPISYEGSDGSIDSQFYWAYCGSSGSEGNVSSPTIGKWSWFSYFTFFENGYYDDNNVYHDWTTEQIASGEAKVDSHTLVHETGHALSLWDYYDTSYSNIDPIGAVDMMCYNIGDHCPYSKAVLGWVTPYMVYGSTEITIKPFESSGDCIFIPYAGYYEDGGSNKKTYFTQYISIEYYTPTGLWEQDATYALRGNYPTCPTSTGIRIMHVDSRLGQFTYTSSSGALRWIGYSDTIVSSSTASSTTFTRIGKSNSKVDEYAHNEGEYMLTLLPRTGLVGEASRFNNDALFQQGDVFNGEGSAYSNYQMHENNDGSTNAFGFTIEITSITAEAATIKITRN